SADEPAGEPPGSAGVLGPGGRLLSPTGRWRTRAVPKGLYRPGRLREDRGGGPRHPERPALPEPGSGWGRPAGDRPAGPGHGCKIGMSSRWDEADDRYALLIVLQAMDAAGKDGTIKHVMSGVNPQGCQVFSFKKPSAEEPNHNFLWRYMKSLPERGRIGI